MRHLHKMLEGHVNIILHPVNGVLFAMNIHGILEMAMFISKCFDWTKKLPSDIVSC